MQDNFLGFNLWENQIALDTNGKLIDISASLELSYLLF